MAEQKGVDVEELKVILNEELHQLPAKYRLPMILHYFGGLSREEMAEELGCKPSTLGRAHPPRAADARATSHTHGAAPSSWATCRWAALTLAVAARSVTG